MRSYLMTVLSVPILASCAAAQANPDAIKARNDCRLAARIVATGHPAPHEEWALAVIPNCPAEAGPAIASGMLALRNENNIYILDSLTSTSRYVRDAAILDAALEIADDRSASFEARIFSLRTLLWMTQVHPAYVPYGALARGETYQGGGRCLVNTASHSYLLPGTTPLPPDYRDQIDALAVRLEADSSEADDIRGVAWCLKQ